MNVVFWSWFPGAACVSSSALALALSTAIDHKVTCSLMQLHFQNNGLFNYIIPPADSKEISYFENTGVDSLIRTTRGNAVTNEDIVNCSFSFAEQRLNVFTATSMKDEIVYRNGFIDASENLFNALNGAFKVNYIDAPAGINDYSKVALQLADIIVICIPQTTWSINYFFKHFQFPGKKLFFLFGNYDKKASVSVHNVSMAHRKVMKNSNTGYVLHSTEYANEMNHSRSISFYLRNTKCKTSDSNFAFMDGTRKTSAKLLKMCGFNKE